MTLATPMMQFDAGSAAGSPLPRALDFPGADDATLRLGSAGEARAVAGVMPLTTREPLLPARGLLLAGLALMGLGGVAVGLALALGLGGIMGAGIGVLMMLALASALTALIAHQLAQPARAALRRADSLVRHYAGRSLRASGDDFSRLDKALDEVSSALLEHAARVRRDHLEELRNSLDLQRQYALMRLLRALAAAPRDNDQLAPMLAGALQEIGQYLDWPLGRVIAFAPDGRRTGSSHWLRPADARFAGFIAAVDCADASGAAAGGGVGARALATGMPHWITAVANAGDFALAAQAADCGLKTALAIPVLAHGRVAALIEFHADRRVEASAEMIDVVDAICIELSHAAEQLHARMRSPSASRARSRASARARGKSERGRASAEPVSRNS